MKTKKKLKAIWIAAILASAIGISGLFLYVDIYKESKLLFDLHQKITKQDLLSKWIPFSPEEEPFSIFFPEQPEKKEKQLPIPGSQESLPYKEFHIQNQHTYLFSLSYTELPPRWLKWNSSLVLKGALKLILRELGSLSLVGKSSNHFKGYPALDYEYYTKDRETAGTLILMENRLYKIEMTYPLQDRLVAQEWLVPFIQSFSPLASKEQPPLLLPSEKKEEMAVDAIKDAPKKEET